MDKRAFLKAVAARAGCPVSHATKIINAGIAVIFDELSKGGEVKLVGFGKFLSRLSPEKTVVFNGEEHVKEERRVPVFKPGKDLEDAVCGRQK